MLARRCSSLYFANKKADGVIRNAKNVGNNVLQFKSCQHTPNMRPKCIFIHISRYCKADAVPPQLQVDSFPTYIGGLQGFLFKEDGFIFTNRRKKGILYLTDKDLQGRNSNAECILPTIKKIRKDDDRTGISCWRSCETDD